MADETTDEPGIVITINHDVLTMGDMRQMIKMQDMHARRRAGEKVDITPAAMLAYMEMLDRATSGGIEDIPLDAFPDVVAAVFGALASPKN